MTDFYEVVSTPTGWARIRARYAPGRQNRPLEQVIRIAQAHDVRSIVIEPYIDPHYRSEFSRFYATTFRSHSAICDRLHFFSRRVPSRYSSLTEYQDAYKGYAIMRPIASNPVGRTMIVPPPELLDGGATLCVAREEVHPFGWPLTVDAMPFISSDGQYLRCAHAVQWMVLYHAYLVHDLPRRLPGHIHDASMGGVVLGRQLPSEGLSPYQILNSLQRLEMPARMRALTKVHQNDSGEATRWHLSILCRYINSQLPPIVLGGYHAWVGVGHRRSVDPETKGHQTVLYRHDDAAGPYMEVTDPWHDEDCRVWQLAISPLPARVYLHAEYAEAIGKYWFLSVARQENVPGVKDAIERGDLEFRTYAIRSQEFKVGLTGRLSNEIEAEYRRAILPGYIWVVEAIDARSLAEPEGSVVGEVILDTTAENLENPRDPELPAVLAVHVSGRASIVNHNRLPDDDTVTTVYWPQFRPYRSGRRGGDW